MKSSGTPSQKMQRATIQKKFVNSNKGKFEDMDERIRLKENKKNTRLIDKISNLKQPIKQRMEEVNLTDVFKKTDRVTRRLIKLSKIIKKLILKEIFFLRKKI